MNFSWAMDLDPKGANNQIKEAIDKRYLPDDEEPITQEEQISEYHPYELGLFVVTQTRELVKHHMGVRQHGPDVQFYFSNYGMYILYTKWNFKEIELGDIITKQVQSQVSSLSSGSILLCAFDKFIADFLSGPQFMIEYVTNACLIFFVGM